MVRLKGGPGNHVWFEAVPLVPVWLTFHDSNGSQTTGTYLWAKDGDSAAMRLQRWAIILAAFNYSIKFVPSEQNAVADALSRLPLP